MQHVGSSENNAAASVKGGQGRFLEEVMLELEVEQSFPRCTRWAGQEAKGWATSKAC